MITVKLEGGIGNQMFQYAAARALASKLGSPLLLDIHDYSNYKDRQFDLHVFPNIDEPFVSEARHKMLDSKSVVAKLKRKLAGYKVYKEPHFHLDPAFFDLDTPVYLTGYFQSEKYFVGLEDQIREKYDWDTEKLSKNTLAYLSMLKGKSTISVHFRRGDYISNEKTNSFHGTCSPSYYSNSIALMAEKIADPHYVVFSDDIAWVRNQNIFLNKEHTYIDKKADMHDSEEMFLMSQCQNNIVANSSFSWWGAWLNRFAGKVVVAPRHWFRTTELDTKDLVPESWFRV